jgi:saccharopine dehydrogenase-like NADP-dependent oxidoreductase
MKKILVIGAGRSSSALITYLIKQAERHAWRIIVGDAVLHSAQLRVGESSVAEAVLFDIHAEAEASRVISSVDLVISLLPAMLHAQVAKLCLIHKKHLLTASYISQEMKSFHEEALKHDLLFLNEAGLDPGIDHMSAIQVMDKIKAHGGVITSFESYTGGLISEDTDPDNPWRYKFTWNPRNVIVAGQSTARYLENGSYKYIPYQQLFQRTIPIHVPGAGAFEGYANRDSLSYIDLYGLQGIKTILRGTLRNEGFCSAWNVLVQLGCCDDTYQMEDVSTMTHCDFIDAFLYQASGVSVQEKVCHQLGLKLQGPELTKLRWSGLFTAELVGLERGTPAQILEHILNKKWKLNPTDKDLIVMWHRFVYSLNDEIKETQASLVVRGEDWAKTAMAKTVGLPLAIAATLMMMGKIKSRGVVMPITPEFYNPILTELAEYGIEIKEHTLG